MDVNSRHLAKVSHCLSLKNGQKGCVARFTRRAKQLGGFDWQADVDLVLDGAVSHDVHRCLNCCHSHCDAMHMRWAALVPVLLVLTENRCLTPFDTGSHPAIFSPMIKSNLQYVSTEIAASTAEVVANEAAANGISPSEQLVRTIERAVPVHHCAWCRDGVHGPAKLTLFSLDQRTVWHHLPDDCTMPKSHGICPDCFRQMAGREFMESDLHSGSSDRPVQFVTVEKI